VPPFNAELVQSSACLLSTPVRISIILSSTILTYIVCDYASEGNVLGDFISQVSRPIGLAPIHASIN
jgi:hypothetical protein